MGIPPAVRLRWRPTMRAPGLHRPIQRAPEDEAEGTRSRLFAFLGQDRRRPVAKKGDLQATTHLNIGLDNELGKRLKEAARQSERTLTQEARFALKKHLGMDAAPGGERSGVSAVPWNEQALQRCGRPGPWYGNSTLGESERCHTSRIIPLMRWQVKPDHRSRFLCRSFLTRSLPS